MALTPEEIAALDERAQQVSASAGWDLHFVVAPNPEFVGLIAGPVSVFILGPTLLRDLAA